MTKPYGRNATNVAASLFGQSVSKWTHSLPKSRIFLCRQDTESITPDLAARAPSLIGKYELFCSSFAQDPRLGIAATKRCLQSGDHATSRIADWLVAASVLTVEMVM